ncbi:MAG: endonuclease NucS [Candidatus Nanoarchaeia archaeon]|nr:endonuclease NucS [Candidatus Nanoarchaeia archaeon]MDD5239357.1 endonuclease NucS [Candidatus Nanoarchaeia archaeon]
MFKTESEIADFIIKNSWIIEEDLTLIGKEIGTGFDEVGKIDILFKNKQNQFVVIELKLNKLTSSAVAQMVKYTGALAAKYSLNRESIKMILIGNSATAEVKSFCSLLGIRIIEFGLVNELQLKIESYLNNFEKYKSKENLEHPKLIKDVIDVPKQITRVKYRIIKLKTVPAIASGSFLEVGNNDNLFSLFTPKRIQLINELIRTKHFSIRELANSLNRDIKNVFDDLTMLNQADIIELVQEGKRKVPYLKNNTLLIRFGEQR